MTFTEVEDCGWQKGQGGGYDSEKGKAGKIGDGKIFVTSIEEPIRIRTGEKGCGDVRWQSYKIVKGTIL
jgi:hypothetical protein